MPLRSSMMQWCAVLLICGGVIAAVALSITNKLHADGVNRQRVFAQYRQVVEHCDGIRWSEDNLVWHAFDQSEDAPRFERIRGRLRRAVPMTSSVRENGLTRTYRLLYGPERQVVFQFQTRHGRFMFADGTSFAEFDSEILAELESIRQERIKQERSAAR